MPYYQFVSLLSCFFSDSIAFKYAFNMSLADWAFSKFRKSRKIDKKWTKKSRKMNPEPFFASSALPSHIIRISNLEYFPCTFTTSTLSVLKRHLKSHLELLQFFLMRSSKINPKTSTWGQQWIKYLYQNANWRIEHLSTCKVELELGLVWVTRRSIDRLPCPMKPVPKSLS